MQKDILHEQWIKPWLELSFDRADVVGDVEFEERLGVLRDQVLSLVLGAFAQADAGVDESSGDIVFRGSLSKNVTVKSVIASDGAGKIVIQFVDRTDAYDDWPSMVMDKRDADILHGNERQYEFSPSQSLKAIGILHQIQVVLGAAFRIETFENMLLFELDENEEPWVIEFNGLLYIAYPLVKRLKLSEKHPDIEEKLFGMRGSEFVEGILERENEQGMKKYCEIVKSLM